jgi:hypothetical protein
VIFPIIIMLLDFYIDKQTYFNFIYFSTSIAKAGTTQWMPKLVARPTIMDDVRCAIIMSCYMMRFGTMSTKSTGLEREEHGGLPWVSPLGLMIQARKPMTEVA